MDRLKATSQVPQQSVSQVAVEEGQAGDGSARWTETELQGEVTFVASAARSADSQLYRWRSSIDNPERKRVAGGSATLRIALPEVQAMFMYRRPISVVG